MKRTIYMCLIVAGIVLFNCQIGVSFSLPKPVARLTILVIDEETNEPIKDAEVGISFNQSGFFEPKHAYVAGVTDKKGEYAASKSCTGSVGFSAVAKDYYRTGGQYKFEDIKSRVQVRHNPWDPTLTVKLRKIKNPVPMYAVKVYALPIPELDKPIGFDLIKADWIAPYGKGKVSDFIFQITKKYTNAKNYDCLMTLSFSNQSDGISPFPKSQNKGSQLMLPYFAPTDGYDDSLVKIKRYSPEENIDNYDEEQHYFFRVRSIEENGEIIKANYGKIHNDIQFHFKGIEKFGIDTALISFKYYLNPDSTRNVEYKQGANLYNSFNGKTIIKP